MLTTAIGAAAFLSTLIGGLLAIRLRDQLHLILGFSAGAVIGVAFFDLLPESIEAGRAMHSPASLLSWSAVGFLTYLLLDRIQMFHGDGAPRGRFAAAALCAHSYLDGIAIGVAFQSSPTVGIVVTIAVLTHDFSDGLNTMNVVLKAGADRPLALRWLLLDAVAPAAGIASTRAYTLPADDLAVALALFAGFFLYIGASDLIPESYHAHPKFLTTAMTLIGASVLYLAIRLLA